MKATVRQKASGHIVLELEDGSRATYAPGALHAADKDADGDPCVVPFDPTKEAHVAQLLGVESVTAGGKAGEFNLGKKLPATPTPKPQAEPPRDDQGRFIWSSK